MQWGTMNSKVGKWGNSLGIRIPRRVVTDLGLEVGSQLNLQQVSGSIVRGPVVTDTIEYDLDEMLACIPPETLHPETDWRMSVGREQ